jgi:hypothetical protein
MTGNQKFKFRPRRDAGFSGTTNGDRADRAQRALNAYIGTERPDGADLQDMLCDLMHLADREQATRESTFEEALESARRCYLEER